MTGNILELQQVSKNFGGLVALSDVSTTVKEHQIKSIIGPNGAGKTTLFNIITGYISVSSGSTIHKGVCLNGKKPHQIASLGITRTFQTPRIFGNMSTIENAMVGRHTRTNSGIFKASFSTPGARREEKEIESNAEEIVHLVGLQAKMTELAQNLTLAEQRLLEIARCIACEPEIILMDEPAAGLNEKEQKELTDLIFKLRDQGITILLVEHHVPFVMNISDEVIVLNFGVKIAEGTPEQILMDKQVINAYLGRKTSNA